MTEHYYSRKPSTESNPVKWQSELKGNTFRFKTDSGVFSKKEVDFGSRLLIDTFELKKADGMLLDVGCGYGPIGLSIARAYPEAMVHMVDVNERAIMLAKENASENKVDNVKIYESDRLNGVEEDGFDAILTNPPIRAGKKIVHDIFEQSFQRLAEGGELWVVIQKKQGAPSAMEKMKELFGDVEVEAKSKGYFILKSVKC
ncbi:MULTISPECIES: class I SAM-dependent methyltransferase [unclassified Mesobacillus]|uniref:class I SAM-dependent methyltransferase n=1 Tax=unclassified Mesobacillus TaxID=2675270 RepID=UPI00203E7BE1|nr:MULTISPECIES: class I SAM-dependent methyltransferase [unclassified Mesobacillus]MCM3125739.1 class I SAM-dependent methyltransferase [Mesobacillus sp. MER 33]MCM3235760.1 class I SAM-dependent methyltransferase [Mesobacillus sp. MER 48]